MQTALATAGLPPVFSTSLPGFTLPLPATEAKSGHRRTVAAESEIFAEGDRAGTFYKVVSGVVRTYKLLSDELTEASLPGSGRRERVADAVEKGPVLERLLDHAPEARMARASQKVARGTAGDQDGREFDRTVAQVPDELQPVHARHPVVHHEAAVPRQGRITQQLGAVLVEAHVQAFESESELQGVADGGVVVDDEHRSCSFRHGGVRFNRVLA